MTSIKVSSFQLIRKSSYLLQIMSYTTSSTYRKRNDYSFPVVNENNRKLTRVVDLLKNSSNNSAFIKNSSNFSTSPLIKGMNFTTILSQSLNLLNTVEMKELANAPTPAFWYGVIGLTPIVIPPFLFIIFGYSSGLATLQLTFSGILCAFLGGIKWGYVLPEKDYNPSWEYLGYSVLPMTIGCFGLLLPEKLGLLAITCGLAISAFVDLTKVNYPAWFKALRIAITIPALIALIITLIIRILTWR